MDWFFAWVGHGGMAKDLESIALAGSMGLGRCGGGSLCHRKLQWIQAADVHPAHLSIPGFKSLVLVGEGG